MDCLVVKVRDNGMGGSQGGFFAEMRKFGGAIALPW
jgi:hypothetical protein